MPSQISWTHKRYDDQSRVTDEVTVNSTQGAGNFRQVRQALLDALDGKAAPPYKMHLRKEETA